MTFDRDANGIPILRPHRNPAPNELIRNRRVLADDEPSAHTTQPFVVLERFRVGDEVAMTIVGPFPDLRAAEECAAWVARRSGDGYAAAPVQVLLDPRLPCRVCGRDASDPTHDDGASDRVDAHRWEPDTPTPPSAAYPERLTQHARHLDYLAKWLDGGGEDVCRDCEPRRDGPDPDPGRTCEPCAAAAILRDLRWALDQPSTAMASLVSAVRDVLAAAETGENHLTGTLADAFGVLEAVVERYER